MWMHGDGSVEDREKGWVQHGTRLVRMCGLGGGREERRRDASRLSNCKIGVLGLRNEMNSLGRFGPAA